MPDTTIVEVTFEAWPLPGRPFDLVLSATAFHWVDPDIRMIKSAQPPRSGGALAVVSTHHVEGGAWSSPSFVADLQACYERFDPATPPNLQMTAADDIQDDSSEFDQSSNFGPVSFRRYEWEYTYTTDEYIDLLMTYSGHRALPPAQREGLLNCIADLINSDHNGSVTKRYLTRLALART